MATVILYPDANSSVGGNWSHNSTSHWAAVRSNDTLRIQIENDSFIDDALFSVDTMPATDGSACTMTLDGYMGMRTVSGGTFAGKKQTPSGTLGSNVTWAEALTYWASSPSGTAIESAINAGNFGVTANGDAPTGDRRCRIFQIMAHITYTPPSGLNYIRFAGGLIGWALSNQDWMDLLNWERMIHLQRTDFGLINYTRKELEQLTSNFRNMGRAYVYA